MASEKSKLFGKIELEVLASSQGTFSLLTDVPGFAMAQRFTFSVPASGTRRTVTSRLPYNTQGHLLQASYTPGGGQSALYRVRVWARELPGGAWTWYALPVIETPVEFSPMSLPIPGTPESWTPMQLPIPATTEEWRSQGLPIPVTSEEWRPQGLPIPPTSEQWSSMELPIKPTPPVADWVELPMDA